MTTSTLIARSACALGAAILATTALQSAPAEARGKAGGHAGSSAHITTHKGFLTTHKGFRIAKETTGQLHSPVRGVPPGSRPPFDPGHVQLDPGKNPGGGKTWVHGKQPPILSGTPEKAPIPPITGPINPGYPSTPPVSTLPTPTPSPAPIPVPVPTGSSPSPGYGTGTSPTHQYGQAGVYADVGAGGDGYAPCQWFKSNYDRTGSVYWLNRYKVCLWQH